MELHRQHIHVLKEYVESQQRPGLLSWLLEDGGLSRFRSWYDRDELIRESERLRQSVKDIRMNFVARLSPHSFFSEYYNSSDCHPYRQSAWLLCASTAKCKIHTCSHSFVRHQVVNEHLVCANSSTSSSRCRSAVG